MRRLVFELDLARTRRFKRRKELIDSCALALVDIGYGSSGATVN